MKLHPTPPTPMWQCPFTFQFQRASHPPTESVTAHFGVVHPVVTMVTGLFQGLAIDVPCDLWRWTSAELTGELHLWLVDMCDSGWLRDCSYPHGELCKRSAPWERTPSPQDRQWFKHSTLHDKSAKSVCRPRVWITQSQLMLTTLYNALAIFSFVNIEGRMPVCLPRISQCSNS